MCWNTNISRERNGVSKLIPRRDTPLYIGAVLHHGTKVIAPRVRYTSAIDGTAPTRQHDTYPPERWVSIRLRPLDAYDTEYG